MSDKNQLRKTDKHSKKVSQEKQKKPFRKINYEEEDEDDSDYETIDSNEEDDTEDQEDSDQEDSDQEDEDQEDSDQEDEELDDIIKAHKLHKLVSELFPSKYSKEKVNSGKKLLNSVSKKTTLKGNHKKKENDGILIIDKVICVISTLE